MKIQKVIRHNFILLTSIILFLSCSDSVNTDETIQYRVNKDVIMYDHPVGGDESALEGMWEGDIVTYKRRIETSNLDNKTRIQITTEDKAIGYIDSECLDLIGSEKLPESLTNKQWILSYYQNILKNPKRETFYEYEPYWRDKYVPEPNPMEDYEWWDIILITKLVANKNFLHFRASFDAGGINKFAIKSINKKKNIYEIRIRVISDFKDRTHFGILQKLSKKGDYKLILELDGDFLTVYLNKKSRKLAEFISVDDYFIKSVFNVAQEKSIDISKINWPKRASEK